MGTHRRLDRITVVESARALTGRLGGTADGVRADEPDAVHQMRVTARRLRSVLRTYRSLFPDADHVRDELRWLGSVLGEARDAEVLADHFEGLLDSLAPELVRGPVRYRLVDVHRRHYRDAHRAAVDALDDPRFDALLTGLGVLCDGEKAGGRPRADVRHAHRRLMKAGRDAGLTGGADAGADPALHSVRKRAKALRYAAEAISPSRPAMTRVAAAAEALQEVLGAHQDAVVAREQVVSAADRARAAGEDTFTYGLVTAAELDAADRSSRDARAALKRIRKLDSVL